VTTINVTDDQDGPRFPLNSWVRLVRTHDIIGHPGRFVTGDCGYVAKIYARIPPKWQAYQVRFTYPKLRKPTDNSNPYEGTDLVVAENDLAPAAHKP